MINYDGIPAPLSGALSSYTSDGQRQRQMQMALQISTSRAASCSIPPPSLPISAALSPSHRHPQHSRLERSLFVLAVVLRDFCLTSCVECSTVDDDIRPRLEVGYIISYLLHCSGFAQSELWSEASTGPASRSPRLVTHIPHSHLTSFSTPYAV